jgi:hypothetical protein
VILAEFKKIIEIKTNKQNQTISSLTPIFLVLWHTLHHHPTLLLQIHSYLIFQLPRKPRKLMLKAVTSLKVQTQKTFGEMSVYGRQPKQRVDVSG